MSGTDSQYGTDCNHYKKLDFRWDRKRRWWRIRNVFFEIVENKNRDELLTCIRKHIKQGTIIYSDKWSSYDYLSAEVG